MGKKKELSRDEMDRIRILMGQGKTTLEISKLIGRDHRTVKRYVVDGVSKRKPYPKRASKRFSSQDLRAIRRSVLKTPYSTSKHIFESAGLMNIPKSTRNFMLKKLADVKKQPKRPPLTTLHMKKRVEWATTYMKTDFSKVIFTDESRATLDGPDGWASGWVLRNQPPIPRYMRQQGGGGIMIWAGIVGDKVIGPVRVKDGVKMNAESYCEMLQNHLVPWLHTQSPSVRKNLIFQQDNARSHSARYTQAYLKQIGLKEKQVMVWPPNSCDISPIENLWSIVKREVYKDGRQFTSKNDLWEAIVRACRDIPSTTIANLTGSVDRRLLKVHKVDAHHI